MAETKTIPDSPDQDAALQLKKRARRRLVGAIALALLAAIVLPMIMDHEPRPSLQDIQVKIPSQDGDAIASRALNKPAPTPLPLKSSKPERVDVSPEPVAKAEVPAESSPEPAKAEKLADAKPAEKTAEKATDTKPSDVRKQEAVRAEKALAGLESKPEAKHDAREDSKGEQWVLQLGAYQDQANVKALQAKIKELGYPSFTEKVTTPQGERVRVRAGPFNSKATAEKAQAGLKRIGAGGPPGGVIAPK